MKQKLLLLLLFCIVGKLPMKAEGMALVVQHNNGSRSIFLLSDKPEMTFKGGYCVFTSPKNSITIQRKNIADFHFETGTTGVGKVEIDETHYEFIEKNTLKISGVKENTVHVYDIQGRSVNADIQTKEQTVIVSLQQLPQGVYIIKYAGNSIKINKR